ncbi:hypothetical protein Q5P01_019789 [Channa striata]|uniref:Uncharacterized protein n=1 Tax=Channa striata TaxID=64152 RepID=A0AA88M210_CHASR|nr:hypothetical protein Q5P01_019789 [Channa striata]
MCDEQEKDHKRGKTANSKSQQIKQHQQSQIRCHHHSQQSDDTDSHDLSSENSSLDRCPLKKTQHSQSCTDISGNHRYFDEGDDTAPLIDKRGYVNRHAAKQKRERDKSTQCGNRQKSMKGSGNDGSFRKAKSMEALTRPKEQEAHGKEDEDEQEKMKSEARKNFMKEKMKFSAFLNEITRQVLSPSRLTTLGVTDAQRPCSPGFSSGRSGKVESSTDTPGQERSRPASADSISSRKYSHSSRHSTQLSQNVIRGLKLLSVAPVHHFISKISTITEKAVLLVTVIMKVATAQDITITVDTTTLLSIILEIPMGPLMAMIPTILLITTGVTTIPPIVVIVETATTQLTNIESTALALINITTETIRLVTNSMGITMVILITTTIQTTIFMLKTKEPTTP